MDWEALARAIVARRVELGHTSRQTFVDASGLSARTVGDLETARRDSYARETLVRLERALGWASGSAQAVLDGDEPTVAYPDVQPFTDPGGDDVGFIIQRIEASTLPPGQREAMLRLARTVQRRQRQEREDLSRRQAEERQALAFAVIELATHEGGPDETTGLPPLRAVGPKRPADDLIGREQAQWRP